MFHNILVVCVGNICRSPMAEGLLRSPLRERGISVSSAGLGALVGRGADPIAVELMAEREIDISGHRARQIDTDLVRGADLILVMEKWQQRQMESDFPMAHGRVYRIGHWNDAEVPDPYKKPRAAFETALAAIERGSKHWIEKLC